MPHCHVCFALQNSPSLKLLTSYCFMSAQKAWPITFAKYTSLHVDDVQGCSCCLKDVTHCCCIR